MEYAIVEMTIPGASLMQGLQVALDDAISKLPIPKMMSYQRPNGATVKFVRPVHRLVALHGADVVSVSALGLEAGRITGGHRFLVRAEIEIAAAPGFEGSQEELEGLLLQGLISKDLSEKEFWETVDRETNAMLAAHKNEVG